MGTQRAQNSAAYMVYKDFGGGQGLVSDCIA